MFQQIDKNSNSILKQTQIETLKSISLMLIKEISSLENVQNALINQIESGETICLNNEVEKFEIDIIRRALFRAMGKQSEAAKLLGLKKTTLNDKIKRYKIELI